MLKITKLFLDGGRVREGYRYCTLLLLEAAVKFACTHDIANTHTDSERSSISSMARITPSLPYS